MKKLFYSSAYNIRHSEIDEENVLDKLKDDIRSKMLGDVKKFVYSERGPLAINPRLFYVGGFYYEKEDPNLTPCENVVKMELDEIEEADIVMASLLKYSSIATIAEILYAAQFQEKEIIIFCNPEITQFEIPYEYWFPILTAKRMNDKIQIIYVKNESEILDFIRNYRCTSSVRIVVEGADGVGKTTVVQKLRELGLDCLDREKTTISPCMVPENTIIERADSWRKYLLSHPRDVLVILTMSDHIALTRRIQERGGTVDKYDREALMYNSLYNGTYNLIVKHFSQNFDDILSRLQLIDVSQMSVNEVAFAICDNFLGRRCIIAATNNAGKLREFRQILQDYVIFSLNDVNINCDIAEDGKTFLANAKKKARAIYKLMHALHPVIADDSGLVIGSLGGFPGVLTHRFLGENATDEERNAELIRRASGKTARFVCELAYCDQSGMIWKTGRGEIVGKIASSPRGENGFGFDPIFELPDGRTLAELSSEEKNAISARRLATVDLALKLR